MGDRLLQFLSLISLLFLLEWTQISSFNLDTENVMIKKGDSGSLFGYSLAMHQQLHPDKRKLLVGAPKAKALNGQKSKITGGLYDCDSPLISTSCNRLQFDNSEDLESESKENQWMGVTVNSQGPGGKIVTCAHRYQQRKRVNSDDESRNILGRCYVLSQDLTIKQEPGDGGDWKLCEGRKAGHELYGSCQQGMSATFTQDPYYLVFGVPGAFNWKGVVRVENSSLLQLGIFDDGPYELGEDNPAKIPVPDSSYLGFSLDSGNAITKKDQLTIVAGAPRANHSGAVVLLKTVLSTNLLEKEYILEGEGLASSFGYDLTVVDLNADGWQDIVVGAPQYFEKDKKVGGAIYVYINKNGDWNMVKPTRIDGTEDSMFGLAVENLGDLNMDNYNDIAVGAPYTKEGGKVFIYHGSADGLITTPTQVLSGSAGTKLFGYSLAGNMDLDMNSYPDLAVGSLSDSVFVYRTRSVINIETNISTTPNEIDLTKKNCGNSICMNVEACLSYTALPKTYNPTLRVKYAIQVEEERRKRGLPSRVTISTDSINEQDFNVTGVLSLTGQGNMKCVSAKVKLLENIKDKLRGIPVQVNVEIENPKRTRRQIPGISPILNPKPQKPVMVNFRKEGCGSDNVCQSKLKLQHRFCYKEPNTDEFSPLKVTDNVTVVSLSVQKDIALEITVTNENGDDAHEATLVASLPSTLTYSADYSTGTEQVICKANTNGSQAVCDLGNPFKRNSWFYIILSTAGIPLDTTDLEIDLQLGTTSVQDPVEVKAKAKVEIELQLSLTGLAKPSQVYFSGEAKGESAMKTEGDVGSLIEFEFRMINLGRALKTYGTSYLIINWPKETMEGKWILYLMKMNAQGLGQITCSPESEINPHTLKESSNSRKRRATKETKPSEGTISALLNKERKSSCGDGAKCVEIRCPLHDLDSNAVILLRSRLWNTTFLEEYSELNYLEVIVTASLKVDGIAENMILKNTETQMKVTVFPERLMAQYGGTPWWPILLAILLGLLMLGLLAFLLWKWGFFKRSKYDDSVPSYNAVRIKNEENDHLESLEKKAWITSWNKNESHS
uniref:Integrin alpha-2 domain-containing protein n=1 Tax=Esox lucius TaxID=8010 RepID=A0A6Q2YBL6_ESOLU